jgi:hypothetical protein
VPASRASRGALIDVDPAPARFTGGGRTSNERHSPLGLPAVSSLPLQLLAVSQQGPLQPVYNRF